MSFHSCLAAAMVAGHIAGAAWPAHGHPFAPSVAPFGPATAVERALRRRIVRLARIKMLERRERLLREFLANAHSEAPAFEDRNVVDAGGGLRVGPTVVTRDFLGALIVRAVVRNVSSSRRAPLLTVNVRTPEGDRSAACALESLAPGQSRRVELLVTTTAAPVGVSWHVIPDI